MDGQKPERTLNLAGPAVRRVLHSNRPHRQCVGNEWPIGRVSDPPPIESLRERLRRSKRAVRWQRHGVAISFAEAARSDHRALPSEVRPKGPVRRCRHRAIEAGDATRPQASTVPPKRTERRGRGKRSMPTSQGSSACPSSADPPPGGSEPFRARWTLLGCGPRARMARLARTANPSFGMRGLKRDRQRPQRPTRKG